MPERVEINPEVMRWAREQAGYSLTEIAEKLKVKSSAVSAWETGEASPTVKQLNSIAERYGISEFTFLDDSVPKQDPVFSMFRTFRDQTAEEGGEYSVRKVIRHMDRQRVLASELSRFELPGMVRDKSEVLSEANIADTIRDYLEITPGRIGNIDTSFRNIRRRIERLGVLVIKAYRTDISHFRGVSVLNDEYPVIAINAGEPTSESKLFTLLHELVHVLQFNQHSTSVSATMQGAKESEVDRLAGDVLFPLSSLEKFGGRAAANSVLADVAQLRYVAKKWGLTPTAMVTRLLMHNAISSSQYTAWKSRWKEIQAVRANDSNLRKPFFSNAVHAVLNKNSRLVVRRVVRAYHHGAYSLTDALQAINMKADHFDNLVKSVYKES